jgi:hypothetical protein
MLLQRGAPAARSTCPAEPATSCSPHLLRPHPPCDQLPRARRQSSPASQSSATPAALTGVAWVVCASISTGRAVAARLLLPLSPSCLSLLFADWYPVPVCDLSWNCLYRNSHRRRNVGMHEGGLSHSSLLSPSPSQTFLAPLPLLSSFSIFLLRERQKGWGRSHDTGRGKRGRLVSFFPSLSLPFQNFPGPSLSRCYPLSLSSS